MRRTARYLPMSNNNNDDVDDDNSNFGIRQNCRGFSATRIFSTPSQQSYWENPQLEEKMKRSPTPQKELGKFMTAQSSGIPESDDDDDFFTIFSWSAEARAQPTTQALLEQENDRDWEIEKEATEMDTDGTPFRQSHRRKSNKSKSKSHHGSQSISKYKDVENHSRHHNASLSATSKTRGKEKVDLIEINFTLAETSSLLTESCRSKSIDPSDPLGPSDIFPLSTSSRNKARHPLNVTPQFGRYSHRSRHNRPLVSITATNPWIQPFDPSYIVKWLLNCKGINL